MRNSLNALFVLAFCLSIAVAINASAQTTWYVDDDAPGDPGPGDPTVSDPLEDGSADHPFDAIQESIDAAENTDTVLVVQGTYVENLNFLGKAITVTSAEGTATVVIDGNGAGTVVTFQSGEGQDSVLDGFTIQNGYASQGGGIQCTAGSSPLITNNRITGNVAINDGGGIFSYSSSPLITKNIIAANATENDDGGGLYCSQGTPIISDNSIFENVSADNGGGIWCAGISSSISNNAIYSNSAVSGGGIRCYQASPTIMNNTLHGNSCSYSGGGISSARDATLTVVNTIFWNNTAPNGPELHIGNTTYPSSCTISYSDVEGGQASIQVDSGCTLTWGAGNIDADPLFVPGPLGDFYLSQIDAGQASDSPCVDSGSDLAENICFAASAGTICLDGLTTRSDGHPDAGQADLGTHYPALFLNTVSAQLGCLPSSGTLPFSTTISASLTNNYSGQTRRIAGRIHATLGSGHLFPNWRAGYTNVAPGDSYLVSWVQTIPAISSVIGDNLFQLTVEDVTPSPYNQPPHPPAGDTDTASCMVTGQLCPDTCDLPHTESYFCDQEVCRVDTCDAHYANCNGIDHDGCETDLGYYISDEDYRMQNSCATAINWGTLCGDEYDVLTISGVGTQWVTFYLEECDDIGIDDFQITVSIESSEGGAYYDVKVREDSCTASLDGSGACSWDCVEDDWPDNWGVDDSKAIYVLVHHVSGNPCTPWILNVQGNSTCDCD